jgi:hypothetical protein
LPSSLLVRNASHCLELLHNWAEYSERYWSTLPDGTGFYGTGFNSWGVQTNQKYFGALATLATHPASPADKDWATQRALGALRFSLSSHISGAGRCSDGTQWGHTWISALGIERMMFAVYALREKLSDEDQNALRRVLCSEADYLLTEYSRGNYAKITGHLWNDSGRNVPESNLWNGALQWRAAAVFPDHPHGADWKERAHCFLINAVSVPGDEVGETVVAGKPVRERFAGANFFPNYALDHHGYLNVGYMVICTSNAAMLHFDLKAAGLERPASLDHHQADLWRVVRRMIFPNGRLARIGGDTRVRYAYCQEYLLPSLLYAADRLGEEHAAELIEAQIQLIAQEAEYSSDGSFYGKRLARMKKENPYYFTRLESDRACALAQLVCYAPLVSECAEPKTKIEESVRGGWHEPGHGAALHRSETRFASFAWRSNGRTQGLCLPPDMGHLAEWQQNLCSVIRFLGDDGDGNAQRKVLRHEIETFDGGFLTWGEIAEGMNLKVAEGWSGTDTARHHLAFAALPDGHTVVGLEYSHNTDRRSYLAELQGLHFAFANDFYNGFERRIFSASGERLLSLPAQEGVLPLGGRWANIENHVGVIGIYGADELALHRSATRRGGKFSSLFAEEICYPCELETRAVEPNEVLLDIGWMVISQASARQTERAAQSISFFAAESVRAARVPGQDEKAYAVVFNFGKVAFDTALLGWDLQPAAIAAGGARIFPLR